MPSTEVATGGRRVVGKIVGEFDTVCLKKINNSENR